MNIAKGGLSWIATSLLGTLIFIVITLFSNGLTKIISLLMTIILLLLSFILLLFFRDPQRIIGEGIVAVADGVIREISKETDEDVGTSTKISTFMNIHNVHVNRMPIDGRIKKLVHLNGAHIPAFKKESENNERVISLIDTDIGTVKIIQIAGTLARRIVTYMKKGDMIKKGEKIGIIRLGSRVDLYLPSKKIKSLTVNVKDKIKAGEDTIAKIND
jgi:phosphatidylserine decarboxylase